MRSYIGPGTQMLDPYHTGLRTEYEQLDDGRWHHRLSQSFIKTFDLCPERARLQHEPGFEDFESDAACVGTAVHAVAEARSQYEFDLQEGLDLFDLEFAHMVANPAFRWVKYSPKAAHKFGHHCVTLFFEKVLPTLPLGDASFEVTFEVPLTESTERVITLAGTIDYVGPPTLESPLKDYKTNGGQEYQEWEYKRWAIQPTAYTLAAAHLGLVEPDPDGRVPFEHVVFSSRGVQRFVVHRGPPEWAWLAAKATAMAELIEQREVLTTWPKQDNHALCSPKWCPSWSACKGAHLGEKPW